MENLELEQELIELEKTEITPIQQNSELPVEVLVDDSKGDTAVIAGVVLVGGLALYGGVKLTQKAIAGGKALWNKLTKKKANDDEFEEEVFDETFDDDEEPEEDSKKKS